MKDIKNNSKVFLNKKENLKRSEPKRGISKKFSKRNSNNKGFYLRS